MLENVIKGKTPEPPKILIYGNPGVGKSTFAADAPDAIFIQTEDGLNNLDVTKLPLCENYADVLAQLAALANEEHEFKTLCFDSLTNLERFIHAEVCRQFGVKNIEKADGGFAKGYKHALNYWQDIVDALNYLNKNKKMMIVLTAHQGVQEVKDPETDTYHRTAPRLHNLAEYMIEEWCDCVFHAKKQFRVQKADEGFGNKRGIASALGADGGERVIRTIGTAAVVAKNRYDLPEHLPLDFKAFWDGVKANLNQ